MNEKNSIVVEDEEGNEIEISFMEIVPLLRNRYTLFYADYRDNLDNYMKEMQECVQKQEWYPLDEILSEWIWEAEDYAMDDIFSEILGDVCHEFELNSDVAQEVVDFFEEDLRETIRERDDSDAIKELSRNTDEIVMFYELGEDIEFDVPFGTEKDLKDYLKQIKKALKIKLSNTKWDDEIEMMIQQGYSGHLVVYFRMDFKDMMGIDKYTHVKFSNPNIAIINNWNGSGDDCQLVGHEFSIRLNPQEIWFDKNMHYSYTYDVCSRYSDWCDGTGVEFEKKRLNNKKSLVKSAESSELAFDSEQQKIFKERYASGSCSMGDMDMHRHRNTVYINNYPCGTKCLDCGTFWID